MSAAEPSAALRAAVTELEAENARLRAALALLRPYFGPLVRDARMPGSSVYDNARKAFKVLEGLADE